MMHPGLPLTVAAAALLAGCGPAAPEHERWFPLADGHRWVYELRTVADPDGEVRSETLVMSNRGAEPVDGTPAWRRRSDSGIDYWLRADASGIYRVASRSPLDAAPIADADKRYVVKLPLAVGTEWQATTVSYLLAHRNQVPRAVRVTHKATPMSYRIAATGESVQVPAGRFDGCLRVDGTAQVRLWVDEAKQWRQVPLTTREWYCSGVGLVRLERQELTPTKMMVGGTLTMELQAWQ
jgi:hypothetical protein